MEIIKLSFIFGLNDIRQKYRRSYLGPWWITIGTFILILTLSLIFSAVFRERAENYILFLSIGLVIWRFIESSIKDFCDCFSRESQILKQIDINKLFSYNGFTCNCTKQCCNSTDKTNNLIYCCHCFTPN